jgi:hypothetical protein
VGGGSAGGSIGGGSAGGSVGLPGETCANAEVITVMGSVTLPNLTTVGYANDYGAGTNCAGVAGADRVFSVTVPPGQRLRASVAPQVDLSISVGTAAACTNTARVCLAGDDSGGATTVNSVAAANEGTTPLSLFLFIDTFATTTTGAFTLSVTLEAIAPGDTCSAAIVTSPPSLIGMETLTGFVNDVSGGTGCPTGTGPDRAYAVSVPQGQQLVASVTPTSTLDPSLAVVVGPSLACMQPRTCAVSSNNAGAATETVRWTNEATTPQTVFLVVDSNASSPMGTYTLQTTLQPVPPGEVCGTATQLPTDGGAALVNTSAAGNDYQGGTNCPSSAGPDVALQVVAPAGRQLQVTAQPGGHDTSLALVTGSAASCASPRTCAAQQNAAGTGGGETLRWTNDSAMDQTVFVVVDSTTTTGGPVTVSAVTVPPPPGETCGSAVPFGGPASFTTLGYSSEYNGGAGCGAVSASGSGPDRVFSFVVPPGQRLTTTVVPSGWDATLSLVTATSCAPGALACLAGSDRGGAGTTELLTFTNTGPAPQTVLLIVDGYATTAAGGFTLDGVVTPAPVAVPPGDTCATAATLTPDVIVTATTAGLTNDYLSSAGGCTSLVAPDGVYRVTLPAQKQLTASVVGTGIFDPALNLVASAMLCASNLTCGASNDTGTATTLNVVRWANPTAMPQDAFLVVDSRNATTGPFELTVSLADLPPVVAAGDSCVTAPPLTPGVTVSSTTDLLVNDYGASASCVSATGADGVFEVVVPAARQLSVQVSPFGNFNPSVALVAGPAAACSTLPRACLTSVDAVGAGSSEALAWVNPGAASTSVFVVVDSAAGTGAFTLTPTVTPLLPGEVCANPIPVMPGTLTGESTTGYSNQLAPAITCTGFGTSGPDRVYVVSVPAGQRLTASVTPTGTGDPAIYLVQGPAAACTATPACLNGDDSGAAGSTNTATWVNATGTPQQVFVVVDSDSGPVSSYTLTTALGPP